MNKNWIKRSTAVILSTLMLASGAAVTQAGAATAENSSQTTNSTVINQDKKNLSTQETTKVEEDNLNEKTGYIGFSDEAKAKMQVIKSADEYLKVADTGGNLENDSSTSAATLPASVDNSTSKYFPPIGNQYYGSCVAWSTIYYPMSYTINKQLNRTATWENSMSPMWVFNYGNNAAPDTGILEDTAFDIAMTLGVPTVGTYNDTRDGITWPTSESAGIEAQKYKISKYQRIAVGSDTITSPASESIKAVKAALANGDVLHATTMILGFNECVISDDSRVPANQKYAGQTIVPYLTSSRGGHGVTIVGYDDDIWYDINSDGKVQDAEKGAFKMCNSWGDSYCNNGFVWISYDALNKKSALGSNVDKARIDCPALDSFIRIEVKTGSKAASGINLEFDMTSQSRYDNEVTIVAVDKNNVTKKHEMQPFKSQSADYDDILTENDKVIPITAAKTTVCDLNNVIPEITSSTLNNYKWSVVFKDIANNGKSTTISNIKIVDTNHDFEYKCTTAKKTINRKTDSANEASAKFTASISTAASNRTSKLGYTANDLKGTLYLDYFHNNSMDNVLYTNQALVLSAKAKGTGTSFTYSFGYIKDGEETLVDYSSKTSMSIKNIAAGSITPVVYVKDNNGNTAKLEGNHITVKAPFKIAGFSSNAKSVKINEYYEASFSLKNSVNTKAEKNIEFYLNRNGKAIENTSAYFDETGKAQVNYYIDEPGHYDAKIFVFDYNGKRLARTESFDVKASGKKCEIYYSGKSATTLYYSTDNGKTFHSVKMSQSQKFTTMPYYASIGAISGMAKIYFKNANGIDNNGGKYYTVSNGQFIFAYGNTYLVRTGAGNAISVKNATIDLTENKTYNKLQKYETGNLLYCDIFLSKVTSSQCLVEKGYYLQNGTKITQSTELMSSDLINPCFVFDIIGNLTPFVTITDMYGKSVTKEFSAVNVFDNDVESFKTTQSTDIEVGSSVKFTWKEYESAHSYSSEEVRTDRKVKLVISKDGKKFVNKTIANGTKKYTWKPTETGTYTAKLTAYSRFGTGNSKTLKVTVAPQPLAATLTTTAPAQVTTAETVNLTTNISNGYPAYKCQYGYIKDGMTVYATSMNSCEATNYWSTKLSEPGVYTLFVDVQDSKGTTVRAALASNITVVKAVPLVGTFRAITNTNTLNTAQNYCVEASATGGKAPYNFRFGYIRNGVKSFDRALQCSSSTSYNYLFPGADTYTPIVEITDANGTTVTKQLSNVMVKSASSNLVTIYYNGYSTPYIHYGINGTWTAVPGHTMCKTGDMTGYTHKYVIDLGTASSAQVCFNDGCNNWQNNNGNDYTFTAGTWSFSNGSPVRIG